MRPPVQTFASVFDAIADTPQESANMRARADLARAGQKPKPLNAAA